MKVAPESLSIIESVLSDYLKQPDMGDAAFAEQHQALPLYADWTGTTYLTTSGEFWYRNAEYDPPRIERDLNDASKLLALAVAAGRHPQLARLLPSRSPDAIDCDQCGGKGQVTIPGISHSILCGWCSSLGWRVPPISRADSDASYPAFNVALARFRAFAAEHGLSGEPAFVTGDRALFNRDHLCVTADALLADAAARSAYEQAVARRLGVSIGALGELPDGRLGVYVYGPTTENEAARLIYPNGLKMTFPERKIAIRIVSPFWRMWLLRLGHRRRRAQYTREYFR